jgi:hypothetical protein
MGKKVGRRFESRRGLRDGLSSEISDQTGKRAELTGVAWLMLHRKEKSGLIPAGNFPMGRHLTYKNLEFFFL